MMSFFRNSIRKLKKNIKFSITNPENFREIWSVNSTVLQVISLGLISLFVFVFFIGFIFKLSFFDDISIERDKLEIQNQKVRDLTNKMNAQEDYISNIKLILSGEIPVNTPMDSVVEIRDSLFKIEFDSQFSDEEKQLALKVKEDMSTLESENVRAIKYFGSPIFGEISQKFNIKNHKGIDIVARKNDIIKSCLAGVIVYSGYTNKDGNLLIIQHDDGVVSVYKHNKRLIKKTGQRVKLGDPIAIIGNTGENTDGPHLHFELWIDQTPVDPQGYIKFKN